LLSLRIEKKRKIYERTDKQTRTGSRVEESQKKSDGVSASAVQVGGHRGRVSGEKRGRGDGITSQSDCPS